MMKTLYKNRRHLRNIIAAVAALLFIGSLSGLTGCGRKAPPRLPGLSRPAAVEDLTYRQEGSDAVLTWSAPAPVAGEVSGVRGFQVYRAMRPAREVQCATCPFDYQFIVEVPFEGGGSGETRWQVQYRETLRPGFHYAYRVRAVDRGGAVGEWSGAVSFVY